MHSTARLLPVSASERALDSRARLQVLACGSFRFPDQTAQKAPLRRVDVSEIGGGTVWATCPLAPRFLSVSVRPRVCAHAWRGACAIPVTYPPAPFARLSLSYLSLIHTVACSWIIWFPQLAKHSNRMDGMTRTAHRRPTDWQTFDRRGTASQARARVWTLCAT